MGKNRLSGLDLARFIALAGMVLVNFRLAMAGHEEAPSAWRFLFDALEGRAAATFVTLAGMGLVLGTRALPGAAARLQLVRRGGFLLLLGLCNVLIFPADILHFYGGYFLLAACLLQVADRVLLGVAAVVVLAWTGLFFWLDYGAGWDWNTLLYTGFWTPEGFLRNLLFNGWHPVLPWLAFLLWGMWLGRRDLGDPRVQRRMVAGGGTVLVLVLLLSALVARAWPQFAGLFDVVPLPPFPLYVLAGGACATLVAGLCLRVAACWPGGRWQIVLPAGRMTLTLYLLHILTGMGLLESMGWLDGRSLAEVMAASAVFLVFALAFAHGWQSVSPRGPVEAVMRRLCDVRT